MAYVMNLVPLEASYRCAASIRPRLPSLRRFPLLLLGQQRIVADIGEVSREHGAAVFVGGVHRVSLLCGVISLQKHSKRHGFPLTDLTHRRRFIVVTFEELGLEDRGTREESDSPDVGRADAPV